ncbi:hypothetical protein LCL96_01960 [Rossellomorea aquimaris]|uniref:ArpU family phage packaging/lysis transcriptional regulator n=1 Tax=Rossellomorea aquimaris TaxID=189382 RepID=UPI001CD1B4B9|nr:ArpU family phage packaging/lysis transcriptional regulator [Rossellomorea aquimaris]MCA1057681.1 hypothetical protein [Rossellomorea aquimaris]
MLPEIDREKTKEAVESALEKYRFYLLTVPENKLPKVTATYSLVPPSFSNEFHSSTEQTAIDRIEWDIARNRHIEWVLRGVNKLSKMECHRPNPWIERGPHLWNRSFLYRQ